MQERSCLPPGGGQGWDTAPEEAITCQEWLPRAPTTEEPAAPAGNLPEPGRRYLIEETGRRYLMEMAGIAPEPVGPCCDEECTCWEWATPEYADADPDLGRRGYGPLQVRVPLMGGARVTGSYENHAA